MLNETFHSSSSSRTLVDRKVSRFESAEQKPPSLSKLLYAGIVRRELLIKQRCEHRHCDTVSPGIVARIPLLNSDL